MKRIVSQLLCLGLLWCLCPHASIAAIPATVEEIKSMYNVMDAKYGAIGNGIADDSLAIQKALDQAKNAGGGTVFFPKGTYKTTRNLYIYNNTNLVGYSAKISKTDGGLGYTVLMIMARQNNITIEGLWLENLSMSDSMMIDIANGSSNIEIRSNTFTGSRAQAVNINAADISQVIVANNEFKEVGYGVLTNRNANNLKDLRIVENNFAGIYADAIEINHPGGPETVKASNIVIANNHISVPPEYGSGLSSGFGIGIAGATDVTIIGNTIENVRYEGIHIEDNAKNISIVGNVINGVKSNPDNGLNSGIFVLDGDYITISGNSIYNATDYGIHLEIDPNNSASNTVITGNTVSNNTGGGMKIVAQGTANLVVSENIVTNNTGHGILVGGKQDNLRLTSNTTRNNGGFGLYMYSSGNSWMISGNSFQGNKTGDIGYGSSFTVPVNIRDSGTSMQAKISSGYTPLLNTFSLGSSADGILSVVTKHNMVHTSQMYKIIWNGSVLTSSKLGGEQYGNIEILSPRMNGKHLQVQSKLNAPDGALIHFDVQFDGMILFK
ncbi:right-handed parallel beta-helix repeat-containing protein [Paenibacillus sedimenti]|uniref:Right-handed parallel beta-helix repeat-containing protein n=1 Tax=Paenibacillus sedimenti TaxID=2770274 RepID=A0A926KN19_9BACL|nr:right-handed parallel beta-helix repeat-containing protein [Paenibacillus sedimenti]MBD0379791.1 right-handed parallel beta-helix repeat-containing protein [Paenibacillus sedimenti]